jgi:hypothetical protein
MTGRNPARSITVTFGHGIDARTQERALQAVVAALGGARDLAAQDAANRLAGALHPAHFLVPTWRRSLPWRTFRTAPIRALSETITPMPKRCTLETHPGWAR